MKKLSKGDIAFSKRVVYVNSIVPIVMLGWDLTTGRAGANPLEYATHTTGMLALVFVMLSLLVTPLRRVTGLQWLAQHRRMIGIFAFVYAALHLLCYVWFDKFFALSEIVADTFRRPFIFVGMATIALMVPLAVTSTDAMIKRLGGKRWRLLHKLNYAIGIGAALHYYMLVKADWRLPVAFFAVVGVLLAFRFVDSFVRPRLKSAAS